MGDFSNSNIIQTKNNFMEEIQDHNYLENVIKSNINNAKSEILIAVNYIKYILYLDRLIGFVGLLKNANNKEVSIIILYSELDELALNNKSELEKNNSNNNSCCFLQDLKEFANVKNVGGLYGNVIVTDNSTVISINNISTVENVGKDKITENDIIQGIYSNHAHLVNNLGTLFETMWTEKELLTSMLSVKKHLIKANKQIIKYGE